MADRYERNRLAAFKTGMDTIQFPYDKPLSKELIRKIAEFCARKIMENDARWRYGKDS